jgi:hypothetical protein
MDFVSWLAKQAGSLGSDKLKKALRNGRTARSLLASSNAALAQAVALAHPSLDPDSVSHRASALAEVLWQSSTSLPIDGTSVAPLIEKLKVGVSREFGQLEHLPSGAGEQSQADILDLDLPLVAQRFIECLLWQIQIAVAADPENVSLQTIWQLLDSGRSEASLEAMQAMLASVQASQDAALQLLRTLRGSIASGAEGSLPITEAAVGSKGFEIGPGYARVQTRWSVSLAYVGASYLKADGAELITFSENRRPFWHGEGISAPVLCAHTWTDSENPVEAQQVCSFDLSEPQQWLLVFEAPSGAESTATEHPLTAAVVSGVLGGRVGPSMLPLPQQGEVRWSSATMTLQVGGEWSEVAGLLHADDWNTNGYCYRGKVWAFVNTAASRFGVPWTPIAQLGIRPEVAGENKVSARDLMSNLTEASSRAGLRLTILSAPWAKMHSWIADALQSGTTALILGEQGLHHINGIRTVDRCLVEISFSGGVVEVPEFGERDPLIVLLHPAQVLVDGPRARLTGWYLAARVAARHELPSSSLIDVSDDRLSVILRTARECSVRLAASLGPSNAFLLRQLPPLPAYVWMFEVTDLNGDLECAIGLDATLAIGATDPADGVLYVYVPDHLLARTDDGTVEFVVRFV